MRVLVIGGSGMLGHKLVQVLKEKFEVWTTLRDGFENFRKFEIHDRERTIEYVDAEDIVSVRRAVETAAPQVLINAVGVVKQLPSSQNVVKTLTINSIFPHLLAELAEQADARLISISTDCVFDGKKGNYKEDDVSNASDLYGKSKNLGEVTGQNCLTLRTSIIGRELSTQHSLVEWFLSRRGGRVKGFRNALYTGFPTVVLADIIADLIEKHAALNGLYHVSSAPINKFELLKLINEAYRAGVEIEPDEDIRIDRSLDSSKFRAATGFRPASWREMINRMADDETPYDKWK